MKASATNRRTQAQSQGRKPGAGPGSGPSPDLDALLACAVELERRAGLMREQGPCCPECVADVDLDDAAWMLRQAAGVAA